MNFLASLGLAALGIYAIGRVTGPSITTEIEIDAPAQAVWEVLAQGDAYPEWNPFVIHLSGALTVGDHLTITVQPEGKSPMRFTPKVLVADPNRELRWIGRLGVRGIFDGEHFFRLEDTPRGTTILRHGEIFRGILAYPLFAMMGKDTAKGFAAMNLALKARLEGAA